MTRRAGIALIGAGVATAIPYTHGMTSTVADRLTNVETAPDPDALLGIRGIGESPRDEIMVVNNADSTLDVTVTTTNFRIEDGEGDRETTFTIGTGDEYPLEFAPENGNGDTVEFSATILDGGAPIGTIELQRSITIPPEPGTTYRIENVHSGLVLTPQFAYNGSIGLHINAQQDTWNQTPTQEWSVIDNGDGTVRIQNVQWGDVLGVADDSTADGASVILRPWNGGDDRRWTTLSNPDGSYRLINENSGLAADVDGESTATGANVIQWPWKGGDAVPNQKWIFKPV